MLKPQIVRQVIAEGRQLRARLRKIKEQLRSDARRPCRCLASAGLPPGDPEKDETCSPCQARAEGLPGPAASDDGAPGVADSEAAQSADESPPGTAGDSPPAEASHV